MVHVAGRVLDPDLGDHVCLPVTGERGRVAAAGEFTLNGLRRRAKVVVLVHADTPALTRERLAPLVPGFADIESSGQVEILSCADTHFTGGRPDPARLTAALSAAGERARRHGHHGVYALVDASWGLADPAGQAALEAGTNDLFGERWLAAVCLYDRQLFSREALDRASAVHPITPEQALLRFATTCAPPGLRLWGDADLTNRQALASVLARLEREPGRVVIDARDLDFIDAGSARLFTAAGLARPPGSTVVVCRETVARVLRLVGADDHLTLCRAGDV
ncbi:MEDS domain-containing protein [Nonomuraea pusilla]|uniref:MEDS domain-containing protein n=1 Tax=Nonomuraea pusilla TaxID=46177 RepID=UPI0015A63A05|nr:MEDS domain-containing protein [Nonomuraea pusilla]